MMEYKGYIGKVEIDGDAGLFHGEVINIRDVVTFEGRTVTELRRAFRESVEDYLAFCAERGVAEWVRDDVALGNPEPLALQHLHRAIDLLLEHGEAIQREVVFATADLLNLDVGLLFFDTTSTSVERDAEDEEQLIRYGPSKDHRPDRPQVVIGLAVTKEGIPVRCWVLPGHTQDMTTVEQVQGDLRGWRLARSIWVMDRGVNSEANRTILQRVGGHYSVQCGLVSPVSGD